MSVSELPPIYTGLDRGSRAGNVTITTTTQHDGVTVPFSSRLAVRTRRITGTSSVRDQVSSRRAAASVKDTKRSRVELVSAIIIIITIITIMTIITITLDDITNAWLIAGRRRSVFNARRRRFASALRYGVSAGEALANRTKTNKFFSSSSTSPN